MNANNSTIRRNSINKVSAGQTSPDSPSSTISSQSPSPIRRRRTSIGFKNQTKAKNIIGGIKYLKVNAPSTLDSSENDESYDNSNGSSNSGCNDNNNSNSVNNTNSSTKKRASVRKKSLIYSKSPGIGSLGVLSAINEKSSSNIAVNDGTTSNSNDSNDTNVVNKDNIDDNIVVTTNAAASSQSTSKTDITGNSKKHWGCLLCRNRRNPIKSQFCITCKLPRQNDRFGLTDVYGNFYLCKAETANVLSTVFIFRVSSSAITSGSAKALAHDVMLKEKGNCCRVLLPQISNNLEECVKEALSNYIKSCEEEDEEEEEKHIDNKSPTKSISHADIERQLENKENTRWDWQKDRDPNKTLFDQVLDNASKLAYDHNIGRYIDSSMASFSPEKLHDKMTYPSYMQHQVSELKKQVHEVKRRREDILQGNMFLYEFEPPSRDEERQACSLCEHQFPASTLLGQVTFKAVASWKESHGIPIPPHDLRLSSTRVHNRASLCLFCVQFFDTSFGDAVETSAIHESMGFDKTSSISRQMNFSNKAYKRIMDQFLKKQQDLEDRPLSRMKQSMALQQLKFRQEASNPELRFQYNPHVQSTHFIDNNKSGRFLREKYGDMGVVLSEMKKGKKQAAYAKERMFRLKSLMATENGSKSNSIIEGDRSGAATAPAVMLPPSRQTTLQPISESGSSIISKTKLSKSKRSSSASSSKSHLHSSGTKNKNKSLRLDDSVNSIGIGNDSSILSSSSKNKKKKKKKKKQPDESILEGSNESIDTVGLALVSSTNQFGGSNKDDPTVVIENENPLKQRKPLILMVPDLKTGKKQRIELPRLHLRDNKSIDQHVTNDGGNQNFVSSTKSDSLSHSVSFTNDNFEQKQLLKPLSIIQDGEIHTISHPTITILEKPTAPKLQLNQKIKTKTSPEKRKVLAKNKVFETKTVDLSSSMYEDFTTKKIVKNANSKPKQNKGSISFPSSKSPSSTKTSNKVGFASTNKSVINYSVDEYNNDNEYADEEFEENNMDRGDTASSMRVSFEVEEEYDDDSDAEAFEINSQLLHKQTAATASNENTSSKTQSKSSKVVLWGGESVDIEVEDDFDNLDETIASYAFATEGTIASQNVQPDFFSPRSRGSTRGRGGQRDSYLFDRESIELLSRGSGSGRKRSIKKRVGTPKLRSIGGESPVHQQMIIIQPASEKKKSLIKSSNINVSKKKIIL